MKKYFLFISIIINILYFNSCKKDNPEAKGFSELWNNMDVPALINMIEADTNYTAQQKMVNRLYDSLSNKNEIPWIKDDTIIFLYKSPTIQTLDIRGDMTSWQKQDNYIVKQLGLTDLWYLLKTFPKDARLDYKYVINNNSWVLDPDNPKKQKSGFGYNSAFCMPQYDSSEYVIKNPNIETGNLIQAPPLYSKILKGQYIRYWVYTPANYDSYNTLPVIYITDGQEYKDDELGAVKTVLDNLLAENLIKPVIAVFVDPTNPATGENLRASLFLNNSDYTNVFRNEIIPEIDKNYKTNPTPENRAILGTSYGGNNSCWFAFDANNTFKLIAAQSPSLPTNILSLLSGMTSIPVNKFFVSTGTINDTEQYADDLAKILEAKSVNYEYIKVNEGHSWGNWSALIDDVLLYFFAQ